MQIGKKQKRYVNPKRIVYPAEAPKIPFVVPKKTPAVVPVPQKEQVNGS